MIGRLRGVLAHVAPEAVVVDVGGVGYEMALTVRDLAALPGTGSEVEVHTHLHVREDLLALYGFLSAEDRDLFRVLLGVPGIGPKVAMAILSTMTASQLRAAVVGEDAAALTIVPGIGKRSAQKLLLELRGRLELPDAGAAVAAGVLGEVRETLVELGFRPDELQEALAELDPTTPVEELVRLALRRLDRAGGGR